MKGINQTIQAEKQALEGQLLAMKEEYKKLEQQRNEVKSVNDTYKNQIENE